MHSLARFIHSRLLSFRYAFHGWWYVIRNERNAWIHTAATVAAALVSWWLGISRQEWAIIILTVSIVWTAEFLNTALEAVVDLASPQQHPLAKIGKDVGAAAVLIAAGAAALVGLLILGPPLWQKIQAALL